MNHPRGQEAQDALNKLAEFLDNPALSWTESETIEDALVYYAIEKIKNLRFKVKEYEDATQEGKESSSNQPQHRGDGSSRSSSQPISSSLSSQSGGIGRTKE